MAQRTPMTGYDIFHSYMIETDKGIAAAGSSSHLSEF